MKSLKPKMKYLLIALLIISLDVPYKLSGNYEEPPQRVESIEPISEYAKKHNVRCQGGMASCTCMGCGGGYIDEDGNYIPKQQCNTCTQEYVCDDGKVFICSSRSY